MNKSKLSRTIQILSSTDSLKTIMTNSGAVMENDSLLDFDIFCAETNFTTVDSSILFALSLVKYGSKIIDKARIVFFINHAQSGFEQQLFDFTKKIKSILCGFNVQFVRLGPGHLNKYNYGWGKVSNGQYKSLSHGSVLYEYLKYHSDSTLFTLMCHSDTEFLCDIGDLILDWQNRILDQKKVGVCFQKLHDNGEMYMNSWFSLWKTPILYEYAVMRDIPLYAVDERDMAGGRFYDTGAYLQCKLMNDYEIEFIEDIVPARHWGSMTSEIIYSDITPQNRLSKVEEIRRRISDI